MNDVKEIKIYFCSISISSTIVIIAALVQVRDSDVFFFLVLSLEYSVAYKVYVWFQATKVEDVEADFNPEFVKRMIPKLKWFAVAKAAQEVSEELRIFNKFKH